MVLLKLIRIRCEWVSTTMFGSQERVEVDTEECEIEQSRLCKQGVKGG